MRSHRELLAEHRAAIIEIARNHGARNLRIFGSVARGDDRADSDIDFLVDFEPGRSLIDLAGFELDLEALLGCEVDVLTDGCIHPLLQREILAEATPL